LNIDFETHFINDSITALQREMSDLLKRMAQHHKLLQDRIVFYINNYFHIINVCEVCLRIATTPAAATTTTIPMLNG
jgi:hypothetical protein